MRRGERVGCLILGSQGGGCVAKSGLLDAKSYFFLFPIDDRFIL